MRGFRAVYLGLFFNCVIMATVNLAAAKIANVMLGWPMWQTLLICAVLNIAFAATSGLWGVLVTDFIQFGIAMAGSFAAAYYALKQPEVGGLAGLVSKLDPSTLSLLPDFGDWGLTLSVLIIPLTVQWWSVWYPGAEPGGGSYIAQRMLAAKSENGRARGHAVLQRRPLRAPVVALDHRGAGVDAGLPDAGRHRADLPVRRPEAARPRHGLLGDAQVPAARACSG